MTDPATAASGNQATPAAAHPAWLGLATSLLAARWLVPTESASAGATLWLVALWLALATAWSLARLKFDRVGPPRLDRFDLAILMLALPQIVSAVLLVASSDGNTRAASNIAWEWTGLVVIFLFLRRLVCSPAHHNALMRVTVGLATATAVLGIWQHHVGYGMAVADHDAQLARLEQATHAGDLSTQRRLQSEMAGQGIPLDGPARQLWERRLRDSREPIGLFALANSLGGFLAPLLLVGLAMWLSARKTDRPGKVGSAAILLSLFYCLLLTKSRTAWVGLAVGGILLAIAHRGWLNRRRLVLAAAALGSGCLFLLAVFLTRGIDVEVLTEAPKSLAYRWEYWRGTLDVIAERPWQGTGPGNFRQHYLAHKPSGSSEEIADPHNFVLEATATAGLPGLLGLAGCLGLLAWSRRRGPQATSPTGSSGRKDPGERDGFPSVMIGGGGGFFLAMTPVLLLGSGLDLRLVLLLIAWVVAIRLLPSGSVEPPSWRSSKLAALLVLLVHLLGAGGFSRPALMQLGLLLVIGLRPADDDSCQPLPATAPSKCGWLTIAGGGLLLAALLIGTVLPIMTRTTAERMATAASLLRGQPAAATRHLRDAVRADQRDPVPARQLAQLMFDTWSGSSVADDELFDNVIQVALKAQRRDPYSWIPPHDLGRFYRQRHLLTGDSNDVAAAIHWSTRAVQRYPTNPRLRASLAETLHEAGHHDAAASESQRAMELQDILRQRGHTDKLLPANRIKKLRRLVSGKPDRIPDTTPGSVSAGTRRPDRN